MAINRPVQSGLPNIPTWYTMRYTMEDGTLTSDANLYNDELNQVLTQIVNNGIVMPAITTALITLCRDDITIPVGTVWFNTDRAKLQVKTLQAIVNAFPTPVTPGTIEEITSTFFV